MTRYQATMQALHGYDIWEGFVPFRHSGEIAGWNGNHHALSDLARIHGDGVVIDVGVWKGQSTANLAATIRDNGLDGCVVAVDTFLGSPEHWGNDSGLFSTHRGMPDLYQTFLENIWTAGLHRYVVPMPQTSSCAAEILRNKSLLASLIHVDAAHAYADVIRDARDYWDVLAPGGTLIGDDYHPDWPGVVQAAQEFAETVQAPLTIDEPKWIVRKPA